MFDNSIQVIVSYLLTLKVKTLCFLEDMVLYSDIRYKPGMIKTSTLPNAKFQRLVCYVTALYWVQVCILRWSLMVPEKDQQPLLWLLELGNISDTLTAEWGEQECH